MGAGGEFPIGDQGGLLCAGVPRCSVHLLQLSGEDGGGSGGEPVQHQRLQADGVLRRHGPQHTAYGQPTVVTVNANPDRRGRYSTATAPGRVRTVIVAMVNTKPDRRRTPPPC
eukprot:1178161-Prorocentrum_minimum.AAC.1